MGFLRISIRYKDVENQVAVKEKEIKKLETEKKSLEKTLAEKEKAIEDLKKQIGSDVKVSTLQSEMKELKKKLLEANGRERVVEGDSEKENLQIMRLKEEINKIKETYRLMLDKTGYDPKENKFRPKLPVNGQAKREKSKTPTHKKEKEELNWNQPVIY